VRVSGLDARAQLAAGAAVVLGTLFGGDAGLLLGAVVVSLVLARVRHVGAYARLLLSVLPLAVVLVLFDALGGRLDNGLRVAGRLLLVASLGFAFAHVAEGEALMAGLRSLGLPYPVTFVLVAGARFVPTTAVEVGWLRDAARLRGVRLDGPFWQQLAGWRLLLVPLLVGTVRRGLQLGEAMEARAFGASPRRTLRQRLAWRTRDSLVVALSGLYLALVVALNLLRS
jgi:energy-coupling factor transport system permease protein